MSTLLARRRALYQKERGERRKEQQRQALQESHARIKREAEEARKRAPRKPIDWIKPAYNTQKYWQACAWGWISDEDSTLDHQLFEQRRARALNADKTRNPERHKNPEPRQSKQYANHMATTAARDTRLTMGAKACLQLIRALCGNSTDCQVNKYYLAKNMGRSARTIQRYISELVKFGYIETTIFRTLTGAYKGLHVFITEKVLPFWKNTAQLANWLESVEFSDRTFLSQNNYSQESTLINIRWNHHWNLRKSITAEAREYYST